MHDMQIDKDHSRQLLPRHKTHRVYSNACSRTDSQLNLSRAWVNRNGRGIHFPPPEHVDRGDGRLASMVNLRREPDMAPRNG